MKKWYREIWIIWYLNCFEDEVLHRYHYTRDEIKEGMEDFLDRYGCSDMKELLGE